MVNINLSFIDSLITVDVTALKERIFPLEISNSIEWFIYIYRYIEYTVFTDR